MRYWRIALIAFVALVFVSIGGIKYTSRPDFCNSCHEMEPMYQAWATSSHQGVDCLSCHEKPGRFGLIRTKLNGLTEVYKHVTGNYEIPIKLSTDVSERCLECHDDLLAPGTVHNPEHLEAGIACTQCHQEIVHYTETNTLGNLPDYQTCNSCHQI